MIAPADTARYLQPDKPALAGCYLAMAARYHPDDIRDVLAANRPRLLAIVGTVQAAIASPVPVNQPRKDAA